MIYLPIATATSMANIAKLNHLNAQNFFKGSTMEEEKKRIGFHHNVFQPMHSRIHSTVINIRSGTCSKLKF